MASIAKFDTWQDSNSKPLYGARAWVNFNGTGTVAIRASGNVSSITDNGVGDYTVNFTNALEDANYATIGTAQYLNNGGQTIFEGPNDPSTASVRVRTKSNTNTSYDSVYVSVAIFR